MRLVIDMGHTPTSPGASGYLDELSCDREAGKRIIAELKKRGHTVYNSTPADNIGYPTEINKRVSYVNSLSNIDLFVSLHLNAGGGTGTEVLYYYADSTGKKYATQISKNVSKALNLRDRGPKANDWVGVICNTYPTALLIEFCFVDSKADADAWHKCPWNDLVTAVCDGIEMKDWKKPTPAPAPTPSVPDAWTLQMYETNGTNAQLFNIIWDKNNEWFKLKCKADGRCLDVKDGATTRGARVQLYKENNTDAQWWKAEPLKIDGGYKPSQNTPLLLIPKCARDLVLDISGEADYNGAIVQTWTRNYKHHQQWNMLDLGNGYATIVTNHGAHRALDCKNGGK